MGESIISRRGGGADASDATAVAADILTGKTAYINDSGDPVTGSMTNNGAVNHSLTINGTYTIPIGYHNGSGKVTQSITTKGTATITPNTSNQTIAANQYLSGVQTIKGDANLVTGNIKSGVSIFGISGKSSVVETSDANATVDKILSGRIGYVNGSKLTGTIVNRGTLSSTLDINGTYTIPAGYHSGSGKVTQSIPTKGAAIITPGVSDQIIDAGTYLSGDQIIKGDTNLIASNIKSGVTIFGVTGTYILRQIRSITASSLSQPRTNFCPGTLYNKYALFAGGSLNGTVSSSTSLIDVYNTSFVRQQNLALSGNRCNMSSTSVSNNYVIFAGGVGESSGMSVNIVDVFNSTGGRTVATPLSSQRQGIGAVSINFGGVKYALFAGGIYCSTQISTSMASNNTIDVYNQYLTKGTNLNLTYALNQSTGCELGRNDNGSEILNEYALFAGGGSMSVSYSTVDVINSNLVKTQISPLGMVAKNVSYATVGNYTLIRGTSSSVMDSSIQVYNTSLVKSTNLSSGSRTSDGMRGASIRDHALFAGGASNSTVDIYNASLVSSTINLASTYSGVRNLKATVLGDYAMFAVEHSSNNVIDAISYN